MKKFKFNLDSVLDVKKSEEERHLKELSELERDIRIMRSDLESTHLEREQAALELATVQERRTSSADLSSYLSYYQQLQERISRKEDEIMLKQNQIGGKRQELTAAVQERKTLEKLKEKQYAAWKTKMEKAESALLDEMATMRYLRQAGGLENE